MTNFDPEDAKTQLADRIIALGVDEEEAKEMAKREIESMGIYRIQNGTCPRGCNNAMACTFCPTGHMTECHHPYSCEEANCGHYQDFMAQEE